MLSTKRYHFKAAALPLALAIFLGIGSLYSCSENPPTQGKDSCDTCEVPCDTCDTTKPNLDSLSHAFTWTEYSIPGVSSLTGVAVYSDNKIYVFGQKLYIFNGTTFVEKKVFVGSTTRSPNFADRYIFPLSPEHYWAVNYGGAYYGDAGFVDEYRDLTPYSDGTLRACWGTSKTDMFFVGDSGAVTHFDGTTWTKMPRVTTKNLRSVWGTSHNDVWAGGTNYSTGDVVLIHYDGVSWKEIDLNTVGSFGCAGCESVASVWAVDSSGAKNAYVGGGHFHHKRSSSEWTTDSARYVGNKLSDGSQISLSFIRGNSPVDLMCASDWGFVSHWNGKTWKRYNELFNQGNNSYYTGGFSFTKNTACIVGSKNGASWIAIGRRK